MGVKSEFAADPDLKKLYHVYLAIVLFAGFLWWIVPIVVAVFVYLPVWIGVVVAVSSIGPLIVVALVALYWIPRFHSSIQYVLEDDKITVTKGVWWKTKSFVPYNRVTNVTIDQGPISRHFGLGKLSVQTAGFSGVSGSGHRTAEAEIFGIKNFEEVKEYIIGSVGGLEPVAVEAAAEAKPSKDVNLQILEELRKMRKALEK